MSTEENEANEIAMDPEVRKKQEELEEANCFSCISRSSDQCNLQEKGSVLAHSSKVQCCMAGKSQQRMFDEVCYLVLTVWN